MTCTLILLRLELVGVFSKNREEWVILDLANGLYNKVMVPIYETLGPESISYVLNHSEIKTCFCDKNGISTLLKTKDLGKL